MTSGENHKTKYKRLKLHIRHRFDISLVKISETARTFHRWTFHKQDIS